MRLALDHHYSPLFAQRLCDIGQSAVAAIEAGWHTEADEQLLELCRADRRALLTNDVADFAVIARHWQGEGRSHHGLIFTSDASLPRRRETVGGYVDALDELMRDTPSIDGFVDRIHWLRVGP